MHADTSNCCHKLLLQMAIVTEFRYLHFSLKSKEILPKKVSSDFSYTLTYLTLKYERNRIFHPCRGILNLSDFYRQALLSHHGLQKPANSSLLQIQYLGNIVYMCLLKPAGSFDLFADQNSAFK